MLLPPRLSPSMIKFVCNACQATISVDDAYAGKKGHCPKCKVLLSVPEAVLKMTTFEEDLKPAKASGYAKGALIDGEEVLYKGAVSPFILIPPALLIAIAIVFLSTNQSNDYGLLIGSFLCVVGVFLLVRGVIKAATTEYIITSKRVIHKTGILGRHTLELLLNKIDSVSVSQGILGRLINYGVLNVTVATERSQFDYLTAPVEFKRQLLMAQGG